MNVKSEKESHYPPALATVHVKKGNWSYAIDLYTNWIESGYEPDDYRVYYNRAYCYYKMDNFTQAMSDVEKCLKLRPKWAKCHFLKGKISYELRNWDIAHDSFKIAFKDEKMNRNKVKHWIQLTIYSCLVSENVPCYKAELASTRCSDLDSARSAIENHIIDDCIFWLQNSKFEKFNHLFKAKGKVFPLTWFGKSIYPKLNLR